MTDEQLIEKRLAFIETCLEQLASLAKPDEMESDIKERRFIEHTLQICVQAAQDVASHIVSDDKLGEPSNNQELFALLANAGWIDQSLAKLLRAAVGFRNVVVHGYTTVDPAILRDILENHLGDIQSFVSAIRSRLG